MPFPNSDFLFQPTDRAGFQAEIAQVFKSKVCEQIMRAYRLSKNGHRNQWRDDGTRYFDHPKALALLLVRLGVSDPVVIIVALLHDIIEDSFILLFADVRYWFGRLAEHCLNMVTKDKKAGMTTEQYFARMAADGPRSWLVKCADRLHNLRTLPDSDEPEKHQRCLKKKFDQVTETRKYILPLAAALAAYPRYGKVGAWFHAKLAARPHGTIGAWCLAKLVQPRYSEVGAWFHAELTEWCNIREREALAG